jgi:flagellar motor switch protein FliM
MVVEPIVSKLSTKFWFSNIEKEATPEMKASLEQKVKTTPVPVKAILGETIITVNEFIDLQVGDVLPLTSGINDEMEIHVGDLVKFYAVPGVRRNKIAMKISKVIKKEGE